MPDSPTGGPVTLGLVLEFEGDFSGLEERFAGIVDRSEDFSDWFEQVFIPTFQRVEREHFESEGAYLGAADDWGVPYSADYAKDKAAKKGHLIKEMLEDKLFESLTGVTSDSLLEVGSTAVRIGTDVESDEGEPYGYAQVQQGGAPTRLGQRSAGKDGKTPRGRRPSEDEGSKKSEIPPRPVVLGSWPQAVLDETADSLVRYLVYGELEQVQGF